MDFLSFANNSSVAVLDIPVLEFEYFRKVLKEALLNGRCRIGAFFAHDSKLWAVLIDPEQKVFKVTTAAVAQSYPALTPEIPSLHWFEREIFEQNHICPEGHPWLKPIRFENNLQPGDTGYFKMQGSAVHEVAVGPVHAGVIEPGHFRFQCMGEDVYNLEISLGYQHRGIEKMLLQAPSKLHKHLFETAAGDSSIAYALVYDNLLNALSENTVNTVPERALILRTLALELERIANHVGDIGALSGDVAFLPTNAYCGRIRGDFLNMTSELCGNRFGRNYITRSGVAFDLPNDKLPMLREWFERTVTEFKNAWTLMADDPGVLDRFENTGSVNEDLMRSIGGVGVAARASHVDVDVRRDLGSFGVYDKLIWKVPVKHTGDVLARTKVRRHEIRESVRMIRTLFKMLENCGNMPQPSLDSVPAVCKADRLAVSAVEAWRGEVVGVVMTAHDGAWQRVKLVDPSFHNWFALAMALRGEQISNFPICNKSFNLSYCGHDL